MDTKVKGIILKLNDYKETDKLAQIFLFEEGIITAKFTGVKKEKAKFKAVAQPFVFADFILNKKGDFFTVTNAEIVDGFSSLMNDYTRTMCGYVVLEMAQKIIPSNKPEPELFLATYNALKQIETHNPQTALISYILNFIKISGEGIEFPNANYIFLDLDVGNFSIKRSLNSTQMDKKVYLTLKNISSITESKTNQTNELNKTFDKIEGNAQLFKQILTLLHNILFIKYNVDITSFSFIV